MINLAWCFLRKGGQIIGIRVLSVSKGVPEGRLNMLTSTAKNSNFNYLMLRSIVNPSDCVFLEYVDFDVNRFNRFMSKNNLQQYIGIVPVLDCVQTADNKLLASGNDGNFEFHELNRTNCKLILDHIKKISFGYLFQPCVFQSINNNTLAIDIAPKNIKVLYLNSTPLCRWYPQIQKINSLSDIKFSFSNNILYYQYSEQVYILEPNSIRHRQETLYETLSINLSDGVILRKIAKVDSKHFTTGVYTYNQSTNTWSVNYQNVVEIAGFKRR